MLKWLKSSGSESQSHNALSRPPWIQKITVATEKNRAEPEQAWKSRLSEKLRELNQATQAVPTAVAGAEPGRNFAFHLVPLDSLNAAGISSAPAERETNAAAEPRIPEAAVLQADPEPMAAEPDRHEKKQTESAPGDQLTARLAYRLQSEPPRVMAGADYELSYSTRDYEQGEAFDIDALFDSFEPSNAKPWTAPADTIEAIAPGASVADEKPVSETREKKSRKAVTFFQPSVAVEAAEAAETGSVVAEEPGIPDEEPVAKKAIPREKEAPMAKPVLPSDRASVTPQVVVNRQQELRFPILKTQRKALEFANPAEAQNVIERLEETLEQFSIDGHVVGIQRGPIITRYELKMAAGIKVNRILALTDELAMALEAMRVRIEAPIPGRSTVGIEIPNKQRIKVLLGDILNDIGYKEFGGALPLPLGRDIAGNLLLEDLTRMPHLLIAGATGSGKSVAVNSFISSLILHKTPEEVRFLLVDPKLVELSGYNDIPHLLHPVITEPNKAILALNWAVEEMERRYEDLAEMSTRDIRSYNEKVKSGKMNADTPIMPYIVVLIDELGDLMMVAGKEVESSIIRLAQKARAVGIHLILATQRPSVDVITALIKANCPARIALQVAQKTDSRTILDGNGAEQLLGQGDMLFRHPSKAQLIRAQVPLIEDNEVEDVVAYAKKLAKPSYITLEDPKGKMGELEAGDEELFEEAWQIIVESQKASASYLQRRLRIGYNKAARLIEAFEARGMIGPQIGSKPREVIGGTGQGSPGRVL